MLRIFYSNQVREADAYTIANEPIESIDLMERAATSIFVWIIARFGKDKKIVIFAGPGNNGGDGLVVARLLINEFYNVRVFIVNPAGKGSSDFQTNLCRLQCISSESISYLRSEKDFPPVQHNTIIIDALFGSGLTRPLENLASSLIQYINNQHGMVISIDIPSGLFGENNYSPYQQAIDIPKQNPVTKIAIKATYTLTFQFPFLSFFFPENSEYVGNFEVIPIGLHKDFIDKTDCIHYLIEKTDISERIHERKKFAHKGNFGHALLIAGEKGKIGAAILGAKACLRTGVGLLTAHIPQCGYEIIQVAIPECMVSLDPSDICFSSVPDIGAYNAIGIGPGIGKSANTKDALLNLIKTTKVPLVIDADAINIIAENKDCLGQIPPNSIFTPHPKEFERLVGKSTDDYSRNLMQIEFACKYNVIMVLKGAYTSIACPDGKCYFNPTGNPGMATAGSGDVLTGIILSLLAQNYSPMDSALIGVYLHGLAGDITAVKTSQEALVASDIIENTGNAFIEIKKIK